MRIEHPLTVTVEEAGRALGIGRSTAYELVRSGELDCLRLRRRIVVPVAHLAERLGVTPAELQAALRPRPEQRGATRQIGDGATRRTEHPRLF